MNARPLWGLVAVGAATAVGITTRDAGFVVITFLGSLLVPRMLGLPGAGHHHCGPGGHHRRGRAHLEERMAEWHRQAHTGGTPSTQDAAPQA